MKVERLDHVHIYVKDIDKAIAFFSEVLETKFSDFIVMAEEGSKLKATLEPLGLEIIQPTSPDSPVARSIERHGEGLAAISLKVPDIEQATAELEARGLKVVGRMKLGGLKEVQFHPKDAFGVMIELAEYEDEHGTVQAMRIKKR